jgi:hypothetical protein
MFKTPRDEPHRKHIASNSIVQSSDYRPDRVENITPVLLFMAII